MLSSEELDTQDRSKYIKIVVAAILAGVFVFLAQDILEWVLEVDFDNDAAMKRILLGDLSTTIPVAAVLALYFFVQPKLGPEIVVVFFAAWIAGYILDYTITVKNSHLLRFERNLVFAALYKRFGATTALPVHFTMEALIILMIPVLFTYDFGPSASSVVALAFGVSHVSAYISNCRLAKRYSAI